MARQSTANSKQDYVTPDELITPVVDRFGLIYWDLAADCDNSQALDPVNHFNEFQNSLAQDWSKVIRDAPPNTILWLNPPFRTCGPWIDKCLLERPMIERGIKIVVLLPVSFAAWFQRARRHCITLGLEERVTFVGADAGYPKDCWLLVFDEWGTSYFDLWSWRK